MAEMKKSAGDPAPRNCGQGAAATTGDVHLSVVVAGLHAETLHSQATAAAGVVCKGLERASTLFASIERAVRDGRVDEAEAIAAAGYELVAYASGHGEDLGLYLAEMAAREESPQ